MHDSTLELFINNENTDDRDHMIDTMAETYFKAMTNCADDGRDFDAISIYEEWVVDGQEPEDGKYEWTFMENMTLESNA
jgi:hypothetical protein